MRLLRDKQPVKRRKPFPAFLKPGEYRFLNTGNGSIAVTGFAVMFDIDYAGITTRRDYEQTGKSGQDS
jgi:hypothetical protein